MYYRQAVAKLCGRIRCSHSLPAKSCNFHRNAGKLITFSEHDSGYCDWRHRKEAIQWVLLSGSAVLILGTNSMPSMADDISVESNSKKGTSMADVSGLSKVEDGSVISNEHTSKWRVFTDCGRDFFMQGKLEQAEKFFLSALQEAIEGFGESDPHVASACNNLAELYRVKKDFDKAEPLYMKAIHILEESFGPDDVRVGAAFHNLGQFFLVQRELEKARGCYEHALKRKRRVLGETNTDYADTMYHLGTVLYLQGEINDSEDLILNSIRILEESGQGETIICIRRLQYLSQIYVKSNRYAEAEVLLRKILHMLELSKGWKSLGTVIAAERLALTLQSLGQLSEAEELLERCRDAQMHLLPAEHIQNAANMLYVARLKMLISDELMKTNSSEAIAELDKAKNLLMGSIRIGRQILLQFVKEKGNKESIGLHQKTEKNGHPMMLILLQSLNALGSLEIRSLQFQELREGILSEADATLLQFWQGEVTVGLS
ncbi:nephrocystin-3-like [Dorcoceras hygrometricum]|nr:nephrocystin-3-like [Dorcoceras hygrometricum]